MAEAAASVNSWFMPSPEVKRKQQSSGNGGREGRWMEECRMKGCRNEEWRIRAEPPFRALPGAGVD